MVQLITKLRHSDLADLLVTRARLRIHIHYQQRVMELVARRIQRGDERISLRRRLHRQSWRWVKRRVWLEERHNRPSFSVIHFITPRRRIFKKLSGHSKGKRVFALNQFIPARLPAARSGIFRARNFASQHATRDRAFLKMKMRVQRKGAHRSVSLAPGRSAQSKDKRRL